MVGLLPNAAAGSGDAGAGPESERSLRGHVPPARFRWRGVIGAAARPECDDRTGEFRFGQRAMRQLRSGGPVPIDRAVPVGAWRSPVSALVWETRGRGFESRRPDQKFPIVRETRGAVAFPWRNVAGLAALPPGATGRNFMKLILPATAALAVTLICAPVQAQTSADQAGQQACGNDAFSLCGDAIPDRGRIEACLRRNYSRVS